MRSKPFRAASLALILSGLGVQGCQTSQPAPLVIQLPETLRAPCQHPNPDQVQTAADLAAYSIRQAAGIEICNAKREAVVAIVDAHKQIVDPPKRPWWRLW